jgi:hypothetical protein
MEREPEQKGAPSPDVDERPKHVERSVGAQDSPVPEDLLRGAFLSGRDNTCTSQIKRILEESGAFLLTVRSDLSANSRGICWTPPDSSRGFLPVLRPTNGDRENIGAVSVLANHGAQLCNSQIFNSNRDTDRNLVARIERGGASLFLGHSLPGDRFVSATDDVASSRQILEAIRHSYAAVGVKVADTFVFVDSIEDWIKTNAGRESVVPYVLEPRLVDYYDKQNNSKETLDNFVWSNVAAYTKDGAQILWESAGVTTPETAYFYLTADSARVVARDIRYQFKAYANVVINRTDGFSGFSIQRLPLHKVSSELLLSHFRDVRIQVQGEIDVDVSPCIIATLDKDAAVIRGVSIQRFDKQFGVHSGNIWRAGLFGSLSERYPGFEEIAQKALTTLHEAGVRGHINIDVLCMSSAEQKRRGLSQPVVAREANIRPAGSSVFLRLKSGHIEGEKICHIRSVMGIKIKGISGDISKLRDLLYRRENAPGCAVVLCAASEMYGTASLAFVGTTRTSPSDLLNFERSVVDEISSDRNNS